MNEQCLIEVSTKVVTGLDQIRIGRNAKQLLDANEKMNDFYCHSEKHSLNQDDIWQVWHRKHYI